MVREVAKHGTSRLTRVVWLAMAMLAATFAAVPGAQAQVPERAFERVASFSVYTNNDDPTVETVAEIVATSQDAMTLGYTDGTQGAVGFVDISDPSAPTGLGTVDVGGEPTSMVFKGDLAIAGVNTSESYANPSGHMAVIQPPTAHTAGEVIAEIPLGGQPDSLAISGGGGLVAIVLENERDEDFDMPQSPSGALAVLTTAPHQVEQWADSLRVYDLAGIADVFPADAEPEFVDINEFNQAVISFQENNHIAIVNLWDGEIVADWNAGTVDLDAIDATEDDRISPTESLENVPREPDAISWLPGNRIVTANEGDLLGGSRGFSMFDGRGNLVWDSGNELEHLAIAHGHYPESRSENKGNEPESVEFGRYSDGSYIIVGSERGSFVAVYSLETGVPTFEQLLPTGLGPEGVLAIPKRDLLVVSSEVDDPTFGVRSTITIFERVDGDGDQPDLVSDIDPKTGAPIPWGALSGLAADATDADADTVYAVTDSYYDPSQILTIDLAGDPATITSSLTLTDTTGASVGYDLEGVALAGEGFWAVSEGSASVDADDPSDWSVTPNLLLHVTADGMVIEEIGLPEAVAACRVATVADESLSRGFRRDVRFGFEGVTVADDGTVWVATQREWLFADTTVDTADGPVDCSTLSGEAGVSKLWAYDPTDGGWTSVDHHLEALPENAAWVGLSDIVGLSPEPVTFATFNASLNRGEEGALAAELAEPGSAQPAAVAEIVQRTRPDVLLVNEFDFDADGVGAAAFHDNYLAVGQNGQSPITYPYVYSAPSNTGVFSGFDLDNSGDADPASGNDAYGFGLFEGQYGMVVYYKYPIDLDGARTFQNFLWADMPGSMLPTDYYEVDEAAALRLSSKSHWDLPIVIGGRTIHLLASHPTPPVFDGPEDRNGRRNHDEIRFWADYIAGADYIYDDEGSVGGLADGASFVIAGDLNADPYDGDSTGSPAELLVGNDAIDNSVVPSAPGGVEAAAQGAPNEDHLGDPSFDTADFGEAEFGGPGNVRVDYVLPSADLEIDAAGIFWPTSEDDGFELVGTFPFPASDHRMVWVTIG